MINLITGASIMLVGLVMGWAMGNVQGKEKHKVDIIISDKKKEVI